MLSFINYQVGGSRERRAGATPVAYMDLGWVRHHGEHEWWHEIAAIGSGSIRTSCNGCMSETAPHDREDRPALPDRCKRCQWVREQREAVERGLAEIEEVTRG